MNVDIIVPPSNIELGKILHVAEFVDHFGNKRKGILIFDGG